MQKIPHHYRINDYFIPALAGWLTIAAFLVQHPLGLTIDKTLPDPKSISNPRQLSPAALLIPTQDMAALASQIFIKTQFERQQKAKTVLKENIELAQVATFHSQDMASRNYLAHVSEEGIGASDRVHQAWRQAFGEVSENIALTSPQPDMAQFFVDMWMNSPGHKANILQENSTDLGVGCAQSHDTPKITYCTQVFMNLRASLNSPVPKTVKAKDKIVFSVLTATGQTKNVGINQVNLKDEKTVVKVNLQPINGTAQGELIVEGQPGYYRLDLVFPDPDEATRFMLISGPYLAVE